MIEYCRRQRTNRCGGTWAAVALTRVRQPGCQGDLLQRLIHLCCLGHPYSLLLFLQRQSRSMGCGGIVGATIIVVALVNCVAASNPPKSKVVKCAVCRSLVNELHTAILEVDPRKTVDIGSYRIEVDGKQKLSTVKYAGSEMHMMEVTETVCKTMKDYAQARHKETGRLEAIKLVVGGSMNPRMSEYDMVQDPDLNKGLEFHCEAIVEEFEDEISKFFKGNENTDLIELQEQFCNDVTSLCRGIKDEL